MSEEQAASGGGVMSKVVGAVGGVVVLALLGAMLFGGLTCGIRVFGGEEAYALWLYRNGLRDGDRVTRHDNGEVATIEPYSNGKTNGVVRHFDAEGRLTQTITHKNGVRHGTYEIFYPSGAVKERGSYVQGERMDSLTARFGEDGAPLP